MEDKEILEGKDIDYFFTIKSWHDSDCIGVQAGDSRYRLPVKELLKVAPLLVFDIDSASRSNDKRRTLDYITINSSKGEKYIEVSDFQFLDKDYKEEE